MATDEKKERFAATGGIFAGYFVIVLHILLVLGLALVVIFLRGVNEYLTWILLGGLLLILGSGYFFYRKIKNDNRKLRDILADPAFEGKSLEVSLLGGMASLKVAQSPLNRPELEQGRHTPPQIEDSRNTQVRELTQIANLLENNLITQEEYDRLKKNVLARHEDN